MTEMRLVPITLAEGRRFVGQHHRHNLPPLGHRFSVGLSVDGHLAGVAIAGRPKARLLDDGKTLEVVRTCTDGSKNGNSMLYGACARAAAAMGYDRLITYTLESEPGTSLRASGFIEDGRTKPGGWERPNQERRTNHDTDMFGTRRPPEEDRIRWVRILRAVTA